MVPIGGNSDGYLRVQIDTAEPQIFCTIPPFAYDYRCLGVSSLRIDINVFGASISSKEHFVTLPLRNNKLDDPNRPPDPAWLKVIYSASRVSFHLGEPGVDYWPQVWDIGFDNPRITCAIGGPPSVGRRTARMASPLVFAAARKGTA